MQNKPNFQKSQMNVSIFSQMAYEYKHNWTLGENKPKRTQTNPICQRVKLMQSVYLQRIMKNNADRGYEKTNPTCRGVASGEAGSKPIFKNSG